MLLAWLGLLQAVPARPHVCYEVFVRSFYDSNGDGIGDLPGLTAKLDYVARLGADCVWLMPVAAAASYHGYDVTDYYTVEPEYGTNADFRAFAAAAHRHHIKVLVDLVLNHTSSRHPWFEEALRDSSAPHRGWYRWSVPPCADNWHPSPVRAECYFGLFWSGMPDLNYENPAVLEEMKHVARFWLDSMGVDGFRIDAARHLVEAGDQIANTPGTHAILRAFGGYVRGIAPQSYTVGEVWDSTGAILSYYPDQLDAYFAFPVSNALIEAVKHGAADGLLQEVQRFQDSEPAWRWATFQRNHDQTRTMTALGSDATAARLAATILLTLPGVPFIYYGEEIGMTGDKPDERLRTPMPWTASSSGFTRGTPWEAAQPDTASVNVAREDRPAGSLLNLYRTLIRLRLSHAALRDGKLEGVATGNPAVLAYQRVAGTQRILVLVNLGTSTTSPPALGGGTYRFRSLFGASRSGTALPPLAPRQAYIYEVTPRGRSR